MVHKKPMLLVLGVGILGVLLAFFLEQLLTSIGFCGGAEPRPICFQLFHRKYMESAAKFSIALIVVGFVLFFPNKQVFRSWLMFTLIYFGFFAAYIFTLPPYGGFLQLDRSIASTWLSVLFVILSILLISYKSWRLKK